MVMRHGTRQQAAFFLETRSRTIDELASRHALAQHARELVGAAIPAEWRRAEVERGDLHRFTFADEDVIVVVGQDGLVANVAKYLTGQPVVGINPEIDRNPGVLVPHQAEAASGLLAGAVTGSCRIDRRTMVTATTDDGQQLHAVNEVYFGHRTHQSARYRIELPGGATERHSSSGVLAGTGTGATGWLRSVWEERSSPLALPEPTAPDLCWFVREAWPSIATGTALTEGSIHAGSALRLHAESDELVCFGDGIESDSLRITWGQTLSIAMAAQTLNLVAG
jgi:hypothetical protein